MSSTTFVDRVTVIATAWLQDINDFFYTLFAGATTAAQARTALGVAATPQVASGHGTYDLTTASGNLVITGTGFTPEEVEIWASEPTTKTESHGFVRTVAGRQYSNYNLTDGTRSQSHGLGSNGAIIFHIPTAGTAQSAYVSAYSSDGFTLTFTKTGSPTGTLSYYWKASRYS